MGKTTKFLMKILRFICVVFVIWFCLYFLFGERFSIAFTDRVFASYFPEILVFLTAASVYGLFILWINPSNKKWQNILLFIGGFLFALLPFLAYHGYFQYQCNFWNQEITKEKTIYYNTKNKFESIKVIESVCKTDDTEIKSDTVLSKNLWNLIELNDGVKIQKAENADWTIVK